MPSHSELWDVFPYPTLNGQDLTDGSVIPAHPDCARCPTRECLKDDGTQVGEYSVCRYGLMYAPVDDSRVVVGLVGANLPNPSRRARRRHQAERDRHVRTEWLLRAVAAVRHAAPGLVDDVRRQRELALEELKSDPVLLAAVGDELRKDLDNNLSQSHDFLQLVKVVRGHAEVLLRQKHPTLDPEVAAEKEPTEGAIFFATTLMASKVDSLVFLNEINRAFGNLRKFEIHPLVLKYLRIYRWQANQKRLQLDFIGECYAVCYYNPDAIVAIIQGLLDNLVKYAPAGSRAEIRIREDDDYVHLAFHSLGPRIAPEERRKIFLPRFRGDAARYLEPSGQGIGLGIVKELSDALDLEATVVQQDVESPKHPGRYETTFSVRLNKLESQSGPRRGSR